MVKADKQSLVIQTGVDRLSLEEVQLEGKKRMPVADFLRGFTIENLSLIHIFCIKTGNADTWMWQRSAYEHGCEFALVAGTNHNNIRILSASCRSLCCIRIS